VAVAGVTLTRAGLGCSPSPGSNRGWSPTPSNRTAAKRGCWWASSPAKEPEFFATDHGQTLWVPSVPRRSSVGFGCRATGTESASWVYSIASLYALLGERWRTVENPTASIAPRI